jgi:hypothetical protein
MRSAPGPELRTDRARVVRLIRNTPPSVTGGGEPPPREIRQLRSRLRRSRKSRNNRKAPVPITTATGMHLLGVDDAKRRRRHITESPARPKGRGHGRKSLSAVAGQRSCATGENEDPRLAFTRPGSLRSDTGAIDVPNLVNSVFVRPGSSPITSW